MTDLTKYRERADVIVRKLYFLNYTGSEVQNKVEVPLVSGQINEILTLALDLAEEIVGADQPWDVSKEDYGFRDQGKHELRQSQRDTINRMRKEVKG